MNMAQPLVKRQLPKVIGRMRSPNGFFAALVLLLTLPLTLLGQLVFGIDSAITVHFLLAFATGLVALAAFDFELPRWLTWLGCALGGAVAALFLLQGLSALIPNQALAYLAFQVLGQQFESALIDGLILWFIALLLGDSQGKTRLFGTITLSIVVCSELYRNVLMVLGGSAPSALKLLLLLPFVWLLLESTKKR